MNPLVLVAALYQVATLIPQIFQSVAYAHDTVTLLHHYDLTENRKEGARSSMSRSTMDLYFLVATFFT